MVLSRCREDAATMPEMAMAAMVDDGDSGDGGRNEKKVVIELRVADGDGWEKEREARVLV